MSNAMWTLPNGLTFVRRLQEAIKSSGYNAALTGSVLYHGESTKDLDVILFPHRVGEEDLFQLYDLLHDFGLERMRSAAESRRGWRTRGSNDTKTVEVWERRATGQRIDLIFLQ